MVVIVRFLVPAFIFILAFQVPSLYAFSLGAIDVKSNFGDRFNAEIPVNMEEKGKVEVRIGSMEDYGKLGLERPKIVDELEVKSLLDGQGNNKTINVVSSRPLFYPSFNLVIRAEMKEGAILENFLVAVDFQQNVSLSLKGKKEVVPETPEAPKLAEPVRETKKLSDVLSLPTASEVKDSKVDPSSGRVSSSPPVKAPQVLPLPVKIAEAPPTQTPPPPTGMVRGKTYGPIQSGESLWRISEKVSAGTSSVARTTVALWMANKEKFLGGNIHGVKIGEVLNLENLDKHLEGLSQRSAVEIVQLQLAEWKRIPPAQQLSSSFPLRTDSESVGSSDMPPDPAEIRFLLEEWRKSWQEADLERHMALFSKEKKWKNLSFSMWKGIKKRMFNRHKSVEITLGQPEVTLKKGGLIVVFDQHFRSDRMETFGQKTIEVIRSGLELKIVGERFVPKGVKAELKAPKPSETTRSSLTSNPEAEIMETLEGWRKSWEEGNLDQHMTYFSNQPVSDKNKKIIPSKAWRNLKKSMFDRNKNIAIKLESPVINKRGERWVVTFDQTFSSDKLKSVGRKYFELAHEGKEWKIVKEEFEKK